MARIVRDAMVADPLAVDASTPVQDAAQQLDGHPGPAAVVVDGGKPLGVVTNDELHPDGGDPDGSTPVREVCAQASIVLRADDPISQVIQLMRKRDQPRLPVVDGGDVVGVVGLEDLQDELADPSDG